VIATSESYDSKAAALNGIESVKKNAPDNPRDALSSPIVDGRAVLSTARVPARAEDSR
jgi:hypothetical protein